MGRTDTDTATSRPPVRSSPVLALALVSRPWFWPVAWVPAYLGTVVASGGWLPVARDVPRAMLALLILGPLVWGAVLAQNDLHDLRSDRRNPRKAAAPLVVGSISAARLARWYRVLVVCAVGAATLLGPLFTLGVAGVLVLGWAYSAPPLRLKTRPGADVAVNAVVVGLLAPLAGWSLTRPVLEFPWPMGVFGLLFAAAFYLPTTVADLAADRGADDTTFAVRYGQRLTYRLGVAVWAGTLALSLVLAGLDVFVPPSTWPTQLALAPVLLVAYAVLTRRPTVFRLACLAAVFMLPTVGFATAYVEAAHAAALPPPAAQLYRVGAY
ncbi:MAG TPA: UbiA prenyltransferase family protein [Pilimelia sp.]|nr:UbiA prenyltransferase family protein [Pilimelia sp.]